VKQYIMQLRVRCQLSLWLYKRLPEMIHYSLHSVKAGSGRALGRWTPAVSLIRTAGRMPLTLAS